ncbi:chitin disaccharide deacetylase [Ectobacillus ponti]|uniref:Chitin disaccharide deacetylase n=1 Tax=Ectobacillus ponti TaxID=2961894 RepID=A0AA41X314_9BACI|nr:chitin disaccharide deacetylase [Ectobacillus ponti]MCP8967682.1 chitin disaccharide deacetylase [Ectobacillus ponti]
MIELVVTADDFGLSKGVNYGILEAHISGLVNSASLLMNMPATDHALQLARCHPLLGVGVHLVLTAGRPLRKDVPSLVNGQGSFHTLAKLGRVQLNPAEAEAEWRAQIESCLAAGIRPTHLSSHHHVHGRPELAPVMERLAAAYDLPVRRCTNGEQLNAFSDVLLTDFHGEGAEEDYFATIRERVADGVRAEVITHPGFLDADLLRLSAYTSSRVKELDILTTSRLPDGVQLVSYA